MIIPESLLPYTRKTLLLVCDRSQAIFYKVHDRTMEEIGVLTHDRLPLGEEERYNVTISQTRLAKSQDENLKGREAVRFFSTMAQRCAEIRNEFVYHQLIVVVPEDLKHTVSNALDSIISTLEQVLVVPKHLTNTPQIQLLEHIDEYRKKVTDS